MNLSTAIKTYWLHLTHFFKSVKITGSIAPSSPLLARKMTDFLIEHTEDPTSPQLNILELGPGTGPLTKCLVNHMKPKDHLDIVEINEHFYNHIDEHYSRNNVLVHHTDVRNFTPKRRYHFIFSSIPFEILTSDLARSIWDKKIDLIHPDGGFIVYYKYKQLNPFKHEFEADIVKKYLYEKKHALVNIPPATCYALRIPPRDFD